MFRDAKTGQEATYRDALVRHGLLIPTGARGVYGFGGEFDRALQGFDAYITRAGRPEGAEIVRFPSLLPRADLEHSGYLKSFPQLAGVVHSFEGDERAHVDMLRAVAHGGAWAGALGMTDVVLTPAACYSIYPTLANLTLPPAGRLFDVLGVCFRQEPSDDPARMRMFRQREYVYVGDAERCRAHSARWLERSQAMLLELELPADAVVANDPFFGRSGRMLASAQREQALKFEILVQIAGDEPTAVASFNYHQDHFAGLYGIETAAGETAHTACLGFGEERIVLALLARYGLEPGEWPADVRGELGLG
jgi:seryl-tRNA synthetase